MVNRIFTQAEGPLPDEDEALGDFHVVSGPFGALCVTAETAREIARQLERRLPPRWIVFRDRAGSLVRLRARDVRAICESTAVQRAYDRRMHRAREREARAERRPWDEP
jgi:hypothetical protein